MNADERHQADTAHQADTPHRADILHRADETRQPGQARRVIKSILGLTVGLLALGIWFYLIGFQNTLSTLKTVAPAPAIVATLSWIVAMGLRSWKWHIVLLSTQQTSPARLARLSPT